MEKIYLNGINAKQGKFGLRVSINVEKFIAELQKNKNEKGFVNINVNERREADKFGNTHSFQLDTWQPNESKSDLPFTN
jgi:hypothetical protein